MSKEQDGVWGDTQDFGFNSCADETREEKQIGGRSYSFNLEIPMFKVYEGHAGGPGGSRI